MSDLNIKPLNIEQARDINLIDYDITLKLDGTLIYYKDKKLYSPRCERSERFNHILTILNENNFPDCMGEMFIDQPQSNVFDVSKKENWNKAKFMIFDLINTNDSYKQRQNIIKEKIAMLSNDFIISPIRFNNLEEGWTYVLENKCEGLVIRNFNNWYKIKKLQEIKLQIVNHEPSKEKGTFILEDGNRVSGTSKEYVLQYLDIKDRGNKAIAEIEFSLITKDKRLFQPRLRQITEVKL